MALLLVLTLCVSGAAGRGFRDRLLPLDAQTLAVGPGGALLPVIDAGMLLPDIREVAGRADSVAQLAAERRWRAAGRVPQVPELADSTVVRHALLDLRTLSLPTGVPVAGW